MTRTMALYFGIILTVIASSFGLVLLPDSQLFLLQPYRDETTGNVYPVQRGRDAHMGRKVYVANGCIYCHSQQVRPEGFGADIERGWGSRRSVARDYIYDSPHLLGTMRTGPDLMNIGLRQPDTNWHYQHLYEPRLTSPGSTMPAFPFLFKLVKREAGRPAPADAVRMPEGKLPKGMDLVPTQQGKELVAYLKSMNYDYPLPEAR